jgi:transposase
MRMTTVLNKLLAAQGLWVREFQLRYEEQTVWIGVEPRWRVSRCGCCGRKARRRHDRAWRSWRHLDVFGWRCYLRYEIRRVRCGRCGVRTERVPWAAAGSRFTRDFEQQVAWLAQRCDLTAVAEYFRISWSSVRRIVDRAVERAWDADSALDGLRVIGVDEISYRRHHNYLTVVVDHVSGRVVWAGKDRKVKTLLRFFRKLGPERAAQLEASRTPKERQVLEEQVRGNRKLYRAMLLKDDFMDLYTYQREGWARRFLDGWLRRAMYSKLQPIKKVARMIRNHLDGVVGWVGWQISNGRLEGMNNRIRLLSHRSFGLHSAEALISLVYLCCGGLQLQGIHGK